MSTYDRFLSAVRHRRYVFLASALVVVATAAPVRIADTAVSETAPAASATRLTGPVLLPATVEAVPATPLTGERPGFVVQWLVKDGTKVKEGDALYRELGAGVSKELDALRRQEEAAKLELQNAEKAPPPDFRPEEDAVARAAQARAEAVRRVEAAEAEAAAEIRAGEAAVTRALSGGDFVQIRAAANALNRLKANHTSRMSTLTSAVEPANRQLHDAAITLARKRYEAERRMTEIRQAPVLLAEQIRLLEAGIARGLAIHDGVIRIASNRVPDGGRAADRVVGQLQPSGRVLVAAVEGAGRTGLPDLVVRATAIIDGSEHPCDATEMTRRGTGVVVRCTFHNDAIAAGTKGQLRLASGGA